MTTSRPYDIAIIGGGIVGMATARDLTSRYRLALVVLEAEDHLAAHQSGHNSGVIHSGLYYKPGSLKARNCVEGRDLMYRFCQEHGIPHERCGKVVVALQESELPALRELTRRGRANGLKGLRELGPAEIRELEPHIAGIRGLHVPETGIAEFAQVTQTYARQVREAGGDIRTGARVHGCRPEAGGFVLETAGGDVSCRALVNCAGLQSDRVARLCGVEAGLQIIPFRGEYYELVPERRFLVRNLVYPVPDPRFPFLGVHFTRRVNGMIEAGPNAVLALRREGYKKTSFSVRDVLQMATYRGFWRMAQKYWRTGMGELHRSFSRRAFHKALQRLLPELLLEDLRPAGAGVRAQAVDPTGALVDDFRIVRGERMIHVLNTPSPAATASISIGCTIAAMAAEVLDLPVFSAEDGQLASAKAGTVPS
jgi:L-2-hydroxyglutarate oxidase